MKITVSNIEQKTTAAGLEWRKIYVLNPNGKTQWFLVTPWHYEKAKLQANFQTLMGVVVGDELDISFRNGKIGDNTITFITKIKKEEQFEWLDDEQDGQQSPPQGSQQCAPSEPPNPFEEDDFDDDSIPF